MSGGRFLVSLTEVSTSEKILVAMPIPAQNGRQILDARRTRTHRRGGYVDAFVQKLELDE